MGRLRCKQNRTSKYLYPVVNLFGTTFLKELRNLTSYSPGYESGHSILFTGVGDLLFYRAKGFKIKELLFVIIDIRGCYNENKDVYINPEEGKRKFSNFLKYVRTNKHYETDYWYGHNLHCIVLNLESVNRAYWNFFESSYSKIWKKEELKQFGISPKKNVKGKEFDSPTYAVLTGDPRVGQVQLKDKIYETFGVEEIPDNPKEYDIPWFIEDEFLNYEYGTEEEIKSIKLVKNGSSRRSLVLQG